MRYAFFEKRLSVAALKLSNLNMKQITYFDTKMPLTTVPVQFSTRSVKFGFLALIFLSELAKLYI